MKNFDLKKFLVENKLTTASKLIREYIEADEETVAQAFEAAGIDMTQDVFVVESRSVGAGGEMDEPVKMNARALLRKLEREKQQYDSSETGVMYDYEAANTYSSEEVGLPVNFTAKLAVTFGDEYEYVIFQKKSIYRNRTTASKHR